MIGRRVFLVFCTLCMGTAVMASTQRVGVVDKVKILKFASSKQFRALDAQYQTPPLEDKLAKLQRQVSIEKAQYTLKKDQMTSQEKRKLHQRLLRLDKQIKLAQHEQQLYQARRQQQRAVRLQKQWQQSLKRVAKTKNVGLILEKDSVYFADEVIDLTEAVKQQVLLTLKNSMPTSSHARR